MFCKNCGKDIADAKFCQYCGSSNDSNARSAVSPVLNDIFSTIKEKIKQIGQAKLIKITAVIAAVINIIIRCVNNEIEVVTNFLAQDDYIVLSESGRNHMLIVSALQVIFSLFLYYNARKEKAPVPKNTLVILIVSLAVQVLVMMLRLPAPY